MALTVTQPFAGHEVGEVITLDTEIEAILASENASFVVRTDTPAQQPPKVATKDD